MARTASVGLTGERGVRADCCAGRGRRVDRCQTVARVTSSSRAVPGTTTGHSNDVGRARLAANPGTKGATRTPLAANACASRRQYSRRAIQETRIRQAGVASGRPAHAEPTRSRDALMRDLDSVRVPQLVLREVAPDTSSGGRVAQLLRAADASPRVLEIENQVVSDRAAYQPRDDLPKRPAARPLVLARGGSAGTSGPRNPRRL